MYLPSSGFTPRNFFSNVKPDDGKYMTASLVFRGPMKTQEVDDCIAKRQDSNSDDFVEWIPNNMKTSIVEVPPKDYASSCTFVANVCIPSWPACVYLHGERACTF